MARPRGSATAPATSVELSELYRLTVHEPDAAARHYETRRDAIVAAFHLEVERERPPWVSYSASIIRSLEDDAELVAEATDLLDRVGVKRRNLMEGKGL
jgi:hypothetical protein